MDDLLKSVDGEDEAMTTAKEIGELVQKGGFRLGKWISNSSKALEKIPKEDVAGVIGNVALGEFRPVHPQMKNQRHMFLD